MNGFYTRFTEDGESKERFTVSAVVKGKKFVCTDAYGDKYKHSIDTVSGFYGSGSRFCIQTTAGIDDTECLVNCSDYFEYRNADGTRKYPDVNDILEIFSPQATTKDDERELTRKIERIIYSTMEGSYIRTAFDGCVQDALDNINFDFAMSWKARAESQEKKLSAELERKEQKYIEMCEAKSDAIRDRDRAKAECGNLLFRNSNRLQGLRWCNRIAFSIYRRKIRLCS